MDRPYEPYPIPSITWHSIAPPYADHPYFRHSEHFAFVPRATVFSMVNAWWLCEAATLAYSDESFVRPIFKGAGLTDVQFFSGASTQCYVASNDQLAIIAFRGTESALRESDPDFRHIVEDVKADFDIRLVDTGQGGRVHKGFADALDEIWSDLLQSMQTLDNGQRRLWVTGHSLGAALATLAADRYGKVQGLYTFGSPRVGDADFGADFFVNAYRFVHNNDVVTRVPPSPYVHVGQLRYIDAEGVLHDDVSRWQRWIDSLQGEAQGAFNALGKIRDGFAALVPDGLRDHVPTLYALHIWNNLVAMQP